MKKTGTLFYSGWKFPFKFVVGGLIINIRPKIISFLKLLNQKYVYQEEKPDSYTLYKYDKDEWYKGYDKAYRPRYLQGSLNLEESVGLVENDRYLVGNIDVRSTLDSFLTKISGRVVEIEINNHRLKITLKPPEGVGVYLLEPKKIPVGVGAHKKVPVFVCC